MRCFPQFSTDLSHRLLTSTSCLEKHSPCCPANSATSVTSSAYFAAQAEVLSSSSQSLVTLPSTFSFFLPAQSISSPAPEAIPIEAATLAAVSLPVPLQHFLVVVLVTALVPGLVAALADALVPAQAVELLRELLVPVLHPTLPHVVVLHIVNLHGLMVTAESIALPLGVRDYQAPSVP